MITCCKDCLKRSIGCHSICDTYLEQQAEHKKMLDCISMEKKERTDYYDVKLDFVIKSYKKKRSRRK